MALRDDKPLLAPPDVLMDVEPEDSVDEEEMNEEDDDNDDEEFKVGERLEAAQTRLISVTEFISKPAI